MTSPEAPLVRVVRANGLVLDPFSGQWRRLIRCCYTPEGNVNLSTPSSLPLLRVPPMKPLLGPGPPPLTLPIFLPSWGPAQNRSKHWGERGAQHS